MRDRYPPYKPPVPSPAETLAERKRRNAAAYRERQSFYATAAWRQTRAFIVAERVLCELCRAQGRTTPGTEVHHKVDLAAGGAPLDPENLMLLCESCHSSITASGRIKGCDVNGIPLDPNSHWRRT